MVGDDLKVRDFIEHTGTHNPRHGRACLICPPETPEDLVERSVFGKVIRVRRRPGRMQPNNFFPLRDLGEDIPELRLIERLVVDISEKLKADGAEFVNNAVDLCQRGLSVVHRERCNKPWHAVWMFPANTCHAVIGYPSQCRAVARPRNRVRRWLRHGNDLLVIVELVHHAKPGVHVENGFK